VWRGVARYGAVWRGVVRCGAVRSRAARRQGIEGGLFVSALYERKRIPNGGVLCSAVLCCALLCSAVRSHRNATWVVYKTPFAFHRSAGPPIRCTFYILDTRWPTDRVALSHHYVKRDRSFYTASNFVIKGLDA